MTGQLSNIASAMQNCSTANKLERNDKRKNIDDEKATAESSQETASETPLAQDSDAKRRIAMGSSPAPIVPESHISERWR